MRIQLHKLCATTGNVVTFLQLFFFINIVTNVGQQPSNTFCRNGKTIRSKRKIVSAELLIQFAMPVPRKTEIRDDILNLLMSSGIDSKESIPPAYVTRARIFKR